MEVGDQEESPESPHYRIDRGIQASQFRENIQQSKVVYLDHCLHEIDLQIDPERIDPRYFLFHQSTIFERFDNIVVFGQINGD